MTSSTSGDTSKGIEHILRMQVPVIAVIGEKRMPIGEVVDLKPGVVIHLEKPVDDPLDLMVNDRRVGQGMAVRVGENYGIQINEIGNLDTTLRNLAIVAPNGLQNKLL